MPIYEYKCKTCGGDFDFLAKRLSERPETCPRCGATALKKKLSAFSTTSGGAASGSSASACPTGMCCPSGTCSL